MRQSSQKQLEGTHEEAKSGPASTYCTWGGGLTVIIHYSDVHGFGEEHDPVRGCGGELNLENLVVFVDLIIDYIQPLAQSPAGGGCKGERVYISGDVISRPASACDREKEGNNEQRT